MGEKIRIGISKCLLGEKVRFDGSHKRDRYLVEVLGPYLEYVPVCPEVECGMSIPREPVRLVGDPEAPTLVTSRSEEDKTGPMVRFTTARLKELEKEDLCGFIFKSKSPSCGMARVKLYDHNGAPSNRGVGLFARAFMQRFPCLPVEEEGRLHDAGLKENFVERIFVFHRWRELLRGGRTRGRLVDFQTRHKLLYMAHSPKHATELGRIVADASGTSAVALFDRYLNALTECLRLQATTRKHTNVLQHIMGYFKKQLSPDEKQELLEVIESYHKENVPLIVPVTLLNHYVRKYDQPYLKLQHYLTPHPAELRLRNHV